MSELEQLIYRCATPQDHMPVSQVLRDYHAELSTILDRIRGALLPETAR